MTKQSPSAQLAESLSALTDNEASELELARILKASEADPSLAATWSRYQTAKMAIRRDLPADFDPALSVGFASRISAALADEPTPVAPHQPSRWWLGLGRAAVAASVAGAVVIGAQLYRQDVAPEAVVASAETKISAPDLSLPAGFNAPALSARPVSAQAYYEPTPRRQVIFEPRQANVKVSNEQIRAYLNQLVERHTDHAAVNSAQGMLPYARVPLAEEE